jgi:3-oxoacyl-[acyl-carrier protein] reductase
VLDSRVPSDESDLTPAGLTLTGFHDKVAVVTGAGRLRSIGRSIALTLARAGCDLVITGSGRDPATFPQDERDIGWRDVESVAEEIRALGRRAAAVTCDISDPSDVDRLVTTVREKFGRIDILVNNAAAAKGDDRQPVVEVDPALWRNVIEVNLIGTFQMSQAFGRFMLEAGNGGCIVNISSIAGKVMTEGGSAYCASKAGLDALGIRVNAIAPGLVDTSRLDDSREGTAFDDWVKGFVPLGRAGTGDDIASAVAFLCSDQGAWIAGQTYLVDGGSIRQH